VSKGADGRFKSSVDLHEHPLGFEFPERRRAGRPPRGRGPASRARLRERAARPPTIRYRTPAALSARTTRSGSKLPSALNSTAAIREPQRGSAGLDREAQTLLRRQGTMDGDASRIVPSGPSVARFTLCAALHGATSSSIARMATSAAIGFPTGFPNRPIEPAPTGAARPKFLQPEPTSHLTRHS
jgi:hypothetical protein